MAIRKDRLVFAMIAVLIAFLTAPYFYLWFGQQVSFILAALVAVAFFLDFTEFLIVLFFGLAFLAWQPRFDFSFLILMILPVAAYFAKNTLPFLKGINFILDTLLAFLAFYLLEDWDFIFKNPVIFIYDFAASLLFGSLIFIVLYYLDESR